MKKSLLSIILISVSLVACGGQNGNKASTDKADATTIDTEVKTGTVKMTKADFLKKIVNYEENQESWNYLGDKPAIIDFYASWCGPCRTVAPILEELANEYKDDIVIYKIDVDKEQELAALFDIRNIPAFLFIPMEGDPQFITGSMKKSKFVDIIKNKLL